MFLQTQKNMLPFAKKPKVFSMKKFVHFDVLSAFLIRMLSRNVQPTFTCKADHEKRDFITMIVRRKNGLHLATKKTAFYA